MLLPWLQKRLRMLQNDIVVSHLIAKKTKIIEKPFRHIIVDNAFPEHFYKSLCAEFEAVKKRGLSENSTERERFSKIGKYDAYGWSFPPDKKGSLLFFYSKEWKDYLSSLFGIQCNNDIDGSFHYHKVKGESGWVHDDYITVSFTNAPKNIMNPWYHKCPHQTDVPLPGIHDSARAIAILYYLNNAPHWQEGDGGETGLYLSKDKSSLIKKISPLSNRLLAFEVSPHSYHAFIENLKHERNAIVQWLHQDPQISVERFQKPHGKWYSGKPKILFTGATGKLGMYFAKKYSDYYHIIGVAHTKPQSLEHFLDFIEGDITTDAKKIVSEALTKHGSIDVLVNNAYIHSSEPLLEKSSEAIHKEFETNTFAPLELTQEISKQFWKNETAGKNLSRKRSVVNISSGASLGPVFGKNLGVYSATKTALNMLTKHLAEELRPLGVRANALTPGTFENDAVLDLVSKNIALLIEDRLNGEVRPLQPDTVFETE